MGLFDKIFNSTPPPPDYQFNPKNENAAIVALMYACSHADGEASEAETDELTRRLVYKDWFFEDEIVEYYRSVAYAVQKTGVRSIIENSAAMISESRKLTVFSMCCDLFFSDGIFNSQEKEIAEYLCQKLNINEEMGAKIIEVIMIRNKDNRIFTH